MSFYGCNNEFITINTPYRILDTSLCSQQEIAFSNKTAWTHSNVRLLEILSLNAKVSLRHRDVEIKPLHTYCERILGECLPEEESIERLLEAYQIDNTATLSIDVSLEVFREHFILNPNQALKGNHIKHCSLLGFSTHKSAENIDMPVYFTDEHDKDRVEKYFSLHFKRESELTTEDKRLIERGPGVRLGNKTDPIYSVSLWRSGSDCLTFDRPALIEKIHQLIKEKYPEMEWYPVRDINELLGKMRKIS